MWRVIAACCCCVVAGPAYAKDKPKPRVPVAVMEAGNRDGIAEPGDIDSTRDVANQLGTCSEIQVRTR